MTAGAAPSLAFSTGKSSFNITLNESSLNEITQFLDNNKVEYTTTALENDKVDCQH